MVAKVRALAEKGMKDEEMWTALGIKRASFYLYQQKHPDFADAIKQGKRGPNQEAEASLFRQIMGYTVQERHVEKVRDIKGRERVRKVLIVDRYIPPNTVATIFFLKNRVPEVWRDIWRGDLTVKEGLVITFPGQERKERKAIEADGEGIDVTGPEAG
jgi:hypothetical protein